MAASSEELLSPKSSLTERSSAAELLADSLVDLPRNSHRDERAKPCCGSLDVAAWSGAVPKTCCGTVVHPAPRVSPRTHH